MEFETGEVTRIGGPDGDCADEGLPDGQAPTEHESAVIGGARWHTPRDQPWRFRGMRRRDESCLISAVGNPTGIEIASRAARFPKFTTLEAISTPFLAAVLRSLPPSTLWALCFSGRVTLSRARASTRRAGRYAVEASGKRSRISR
jgi:hypothetical protein